jgi:chemotaxis protein MotB
MRSRCVGSDAPNTTSLSFTKAVTGSNASLTVDGVPISTASNTVSNVINGVTLSLGSVSPSTPVTINVNPDTAQATTPAAAAGPLKDIQEELEKALAPEIRSRVVDIKTRKEGLVVSLREVGFYDSGAPTMRASSDDSIDRLAAVLVSRGENMRIEGHTDNVPIHNAHFPSNWDFPLLALLNS